MLAAAPAQAAGIQATIDRTEAQVGDQVVLSVVVEGDRSAEPRLPDLSAFDVRSAGQSTEVRFVNGHVSSSVTYNYVLTPKSAGTFAIGAAEADIGGRTYRSEPFALRIVGSAAPAQEAGSALFVTSSVSNRSPYAGEQVIYTMRLFRRVQIGNASASLPDFTGFAVEDLGDKREYQTTHHGQRYLVTELSRAIFPQRPGHAAISPARITCDVVVRDRRRSPFGSLTDRLFGNMPDAFPDDPTGIFGQGQMQRQVVESKPLELDVKPLPQGPADFSGLVGEFALTADLSRSSLKVGETTTLTLTVSGSGNVKSITEPHIEGLEAFKVYDDKPTSASTSGSGKLTGQMSFHKALVPIKAGDVAIAPIRLVYFEPGAGVYKTSSVGPLRLDVQPGDHPEDLRLTALVAPGQGKVSLKVLADDILPPRRQVALLSSAPGVIGGALAWGAGFVAPPLFFAALLLRRRHSERYGVGSPLGRQRRALAKALASLHEVERAATKGEPGRAAVSASRVVREYIGDKLAKEGLALTPVEIQGLLEQCKVPAGLLEQTQGLLKQAEAAEYGGVTSWHEQDTARLADQVRRLVKDLDRHLSA